MDAVQSNKILHLQPSKSKYVTSEINSPVFVRQENTAFPGTLKSINIF